MTESAETSQTRSTSTSVVVRHVTLVDGADLKVHEDRSVFVALDEPPPVRTVVQLWRGDEARAVVVARVVEVADPESGQMRGFFGVAADDATIAAAKNVGTEHFEAGTAADPDGSGDGDGSDADADGNVNMAMPAPVVVHDESDESDESDAAPHTDDATAAPRRARGRGKRRK